MWNKISVKIIIIVSVILLLSMFLTGAHFIRSERVMLFDDVHAKAVMLNKNIENFLFTLVTLGVLDVENILQDAMKDLNKDDVYEVRIVHAPGLAESFLDKQFKEKYRSLLGSLPQNEIEQKVISGQTIEERIFLNINGKSQPFIRYGSPIRADKSCLFCHDVKVGKPMGAFFSLISLEKAYQIIKKRTTENILLFGLVFLFILVTLYFSLRKIVLRPLIKISDAVKHIIERQDLFRQVQVTSADEIGQLGTVFNKMVTDLKKSRDELQEWAKTLEKKVYDRTKDLAEAKSYTEDIIGSMIDTLVVADSSGKIKMVNSALVQLLDYSPDELIGKPITSLFDEATAKFFNETAIKEITEKLVIRNLEATYKSKSGDKIAISFSVSLMSEIHQGSRDIIIVSKDIREIKHLLEMEKQKTVELKEAYGKLQSLQDALIQAEKFNAIGRLASGVAHEVKNPLGIIKQSAEYLKGKLLPSEKNASEALRMIRDNIDRADNIIRVLLDFSRSSKLEKNPEDLNALLENSLMLIKHIPTLEKIKIIRELGKDLPKVLVDKGKIEQVFINLLINAVHAMPGGGDLFVRTYQLRLDKFNDVMVISGENNFEPGENVVVAEIEDTGVGISQVNLMKIFEPFFTTKDPGSGTGLGLSISKNIMTMHKGSLEIKSQESKGTKVIVTFKITDGGR